MERQAGAKAKILISFLGWENATYDAKVKVLIKSAKAVIIEPVWLSTMKDC
ncbi:MAG: hypothetical protein BWX91_02267 [Spirochaetes bacterium ADurb.Bin133]|jgi:hypothetical protein|nr:MAG: hypothetical protein BWX91_02267 [Spirochaetes bacterium ADurb.Bin133]